LCVSYDLQGIWVTSTYWVGFILTGYYINRESEKGYLIFGKDKNIYFVCPNL